MRTLKLDTVSTKANPARRFANSCKQPGREAAMQLGISLTALRRAPKHSGYWINCELRRARNPERSSVTKSATSAAPESARSCASR